MERIWSAVGVVGRSQTVCTIPALQTVKNKDQIAMRTRNLISMKLILTNQVYLSVNRHLRHLLLPRPLPCRCRVLPCHCSLIGILVTVSPFPHFRPPCLPNVLLL